MNSLSFLDKKKILITGASGLIGFNLCRELSRNKSARIFVNYRNQLEAPFRKSLTLDRLTHLIGDVNDLSFLSSLPKFDSIIHLSGYGQPKKFLENPNSTLSMNSFVTDFLLNKKLEVGGSFVFMSSSEVYANGTWPSEESKILVDLDNVRNPYILGKLAGESIVNIARANGVNAKSIRICLAYGPGFKRNDNRVINELIMKGCDKSEINLIDDGSAIRKYIYIEDAVQMIIKICDRGSKGLYNVGGRDELSILDLAREISLQTNAKLSASEKKNALPGSPAFAGVVISRYESEFGSVNLTSMPKGVKACIDWYKHYDDK